jgi:iron complex transport system ATP-binding protein
VNVTIAGLDVVIDDQPILAGVSIEVRSGHVHGIIGPNGSGKSTLLRAIYRSLRPSAGAVLIDGADLWRQLSARASARKRAVVTQDSAIDFDFSVRDVVAMGRAPHKGIFDRDDRNDAAIIDGALASVGMTWADTRLVATLSGGERQRVLLARALAQQAPILVLDEPTNHLDVRAQLELLDLVRSLGLTTIAALHDLDHAASVCDTVSVLRSGSVVASGAPLDVLTPAMILDVFGVRAHIGTHPLTGKLHIAVAAVNGDRPDQSPDHEPDHGRHDHHPEDQR